MAGPKLEAKGGRLWMEEGHPQRRKSQPRGGWYEESGREECFKKGTMNRVRAAKRLVG